MASSCPEDSVHGRAIRVAGNTILPGSDGTEVGGPGAAAEGPSAAVSLLLFLLVTLILHAIHTEDEITLLFINRRRESTTSSISNAAGTDLSVT